MSKLLPPIVREFFLALLKPYTYNVLKNGYAIFGILWGVPVPIVTTAIGLYFRGLPISIDNVISHVHAYPVYVFFFLHPILFGVVFGAMGTVREEKETQRVKFENSLLEMNEELKEANRKLKQLDELKDNFISMVSHELLAPLTTIQGYITFLKGCRRECFTEKQFSVLKVVEDEADYLKYMIEELMDLSRIKANKFAIHPVPTDIAAL